MVRHVDRIDGFGWCVCGSSRYPTLWDKNTTTTGCNRGNFVKRRRVGMLRKQRPIERDFPRRSTLGRCMRHHCSRTSFPCSSIVLHRSIPMAGVGITHAGVPVRIQPRLSPSFRALCVFHTTLATVCIILCPNRLGLFPFHDPLPTRREETPLDGSCRLSRPHRERKVEREA